MIHVRFMSSVVLVVLLVPSLMSGGRPGVSVLLHLVSGVLGVLMMLIVPLVLVMFLLIVICHCPFFLAHHASRTCHSAGRATSPTGPDEITSVCDS
jgi:uncharacterized membrane protein